MIEDTIINELKVRKIDPEKIVSSENDEVAYSLETISHGKCVYPAKEKDIIAKIPISDTTLGFESDTECDFLPYVLTTYNADGSENAQYEYGGHGLGKEKYQEKCSYRPGEKVLCLMYEGYSAIFPGIVECPLTEEYLRKLFETDEEMQIGYSSADEAVEKWLDWNWDSVIVRPLVRLKTQWGEMEETVIVNRVYVFPYKKFRYE